MIWNGEIISLYLVVCKGTNPKRCGNIAQDASLSLSDDTQYNMVKNDATCISESDLCDGCYDCQLGIDESDELCLG